MPTLRNPKHELFAQEMAKGKSAEEAYKIAGYAPSLKNAQRLKSYEGVKARVAEIVARFAERTIERHSITLDKLVSMALDAYEKGMKHATGAAAAVSAVKEIGVLTGLSPHSPDDA